MKPAAIILIAAAALTAPAAASACGGYGAGDMFEQDILHLAYSADRAAQAGELTRAERHRMERRVRYLRRLEARLNRSSLSRSARLKREASAVRKAELLLHRLRTNRYRTAPRVASR